MKNVILNAVKMLTSNLGNAMASQAQVTSGLNAPFVQPTADVTLETEKEKSENNVYGNYKNLSYT